MFGDCGDDILKGNGGADTIYGGDGNDPIEGGTSDFAINKLYGDNGNDVIIGGKGADRLDGGADQDKLYGGVGDDDLYGGAGNDELYAEQGWEYLFGETGNDLYIITGLGKSEMFETSGTGDKIKFNSTTFSNLAGEQHGNDLWISTIVDLADGTLTSGTIIKDYFVAGAETIKFIEDQGSVSMSISDFLLL